jgi:hypothetical protein
MPREVHAFGFGHGIDQIGWAMTHGFVAEFALGFD